jgi:hypothetical protein
MSQQSQLTFLIVLESPPAGIEFGLQKGHGSSYETIQKQRADHADIRFEFTATLTTSGDGKPDFKGPFVQGPTGGRFVYIDIGSYTGQSNSPWSGRLKVPLYGISLAMINDAQRDQQLIIATSVPGKGKDGRPNCATVKPFPGWKLIKSRVN